MIVCDCCKTELKTRMLFKLVYDLESSKEERDLCPDCYRQIFKSMQDKCKELLQPFLNHPEIKQ